MYIFIADCFCMAIIYKNYCGGSITNEITDLNVSPKVSVQKMETDIIENVIDESLNYNESDNEKDKKEKGLKLNLILKILIIGLPLYINKRIPLTIKVFLRKIYNSLQLTHDEGKI